MTEELNIKKVNENAVKVNVAADYATTLEAIKSGKSFQKKLGRQRKEEYRLEKRLIELKNLAQTTKDEKIKIQAIVEYTKILGDKVTEKQNTGKILSIQFSLIPDKNLIEKELNISNPSLHTSQPNIINNTLSITLPNTPVTPLNEQVEQALPTSILKAPPEPIDDNEVDDFLNGLEKKEDKPKEPKEPKKKTSEEALDNIDLFE